MLAVLAGVLLSAHGQLVAIDPDAKLQKWDGWGTSLCWWGKVIGENPAIREPVMQRLFGYLKLNIVRYNIGGGENPTHHHMQPRARMPGFLSSKGKWDWKSDAGQRWALLRAKQLGANRFEAFADSPPYYMTLSGCASGNKGGTPNLDPDKVATFADYLAEVNEHYRTAWGIQFETLEPLNEPAATWWASGGKQEGCRIPPGKDQSRLIAALGEALAKRHSKTHIAASDESDIDTAVRSWDALSPKAKSLVWRINTHHYGGEKQKELRERATSAGKGLWMSEEGDKDPTGLTMAERIVKDLREMQPTAWIYWQAVDQTGSNWGFIDMDLNGGRPTSQLVHKKLYAYANFSRFIRPGSTFVTIDDEHSVAAISGSSLVIVSVNRGDCRMVRFDLSKLGRIRSTRAFQTSETQDLAPVDSPLANGARLDYQLPANSITTFVIEHGIDKSPPSRSRL